MTIPIKKFKRLYHVGMFAEQPAPHSRDSHEGPCLSVSRVPEAWRSIARLGRDPLWMLDKPDGKFLHMHKLSKKLRAEIVQWGYANGYATEGLGWITERDEGSEEGGDEDDVRFFTDESEALAIRHCGTTEEVRARYTRVMPFATEKLTAYAEQKLDLDMVFDMLALVYAEQVLDLDGLFWNERLDIYSYSAPRAGIVRSKLSSWAIKLAPKGHDTKEEEY